MDRKSVTRFLWTLVPTNTRGGSSSSGFSIREPSKQETPPGSCDQLVRIIAGPICSINGCSSKAEDHHVSITTFKTVTTVIHNFIMKKKVKLPTLQACSIKRDTLSEAVVSLRTLVKFVTWLISRTEFSSSELVL